MPSVVAWRTNKKDKLGPVAPRGVDPRCPNFQGYVEVEAHYIFHPSTIWVRPIFTELGPKKTQKADFAMKQANICRLSGDITILSARRAPPLTGAQSIAGQCASARPVRAVSCMTFPLTFSSYIFGNFCQRLPFHCVVDRPDAIEMFNELR